MTNIPIYCSSDQGALYASVTLYPPAGLRSLLAERNLAPFPFRLWSLGVRLALAAACFAGGLLIARDLAARIVADVGACGVCGVTGPLLWLVLGCLVPALALFVNWWKIRVERTSVPVPPAGHVASREPDPSRAPPHRSPRPVRS